MRSKHFAKKVSEKLFTKKGAGNKRDKPDSMLHPAGRIRERTRRSCNSISSELNGVRSAIASCGCELTVSPVDPLNRSRTSLRSAGRAMLDPGPRRFTIYVGYLGNEEIMLLLLLQPFPLISYRLIYFFII